MKKSVNRFLTAAVILFLFSCHKEQKIYVFPEFVATKINNNNTVPVIVSFTNKTSGGSSFKWTFEGGDPATSILRNPGDVLFTTAGKHTITLVATNEYESRKKVMVLNLDSMMSVDFIPTILVNNFSPVTVHMQNNTAGGSTFAWTFAGGTPSTSVLQQPADVTFTTPGNHDITLVVGNGSSTTTITKTITVAPPLAADFDIVPSFEDEDYQAPLTATLQNTTISGLNWQWTCSPAATISGATQQSPTIYFANPGTYTVTLTAGNNKSTQTVNKTIIVLPNTNLRTHSNIKFGINTAHGTVGSFYSTRLRKTFYAGDNLDTSGKWIDLVFFGLNSSFSFNKFISPDSATNYTFAAIPFAQSVKFINSQDLCLCGSPFTENDFNNMTNDVPLQSFTVNPNVNGWKQFNNSTVNRIVMFQTQDGRKGAMKIKQYVAAGADSYIIADIKVQKN